MNIVERISAKALAKSDSPLLLCLTFDNMGSAAAVRRGERTHQDPDDPSISIGYPRVLALLRDLGMRASFFIEGWNALHNTSTCRSLIEAGHEIGLHGWIHEQFGELSLHDAERLLVDAQAAFRLIGIEPVGFRAPGGRRNDGLLAIVDRLGLGFDASFAGEDTPIKPSLLAHGIPGVPWRWRMIDYFQYQMHPEGPRSPRQLEELFRGELSAARETGEMVTWIFHAFVSGVDEDRFSAMRRLLEDVAKDSSIEVVPASTIGKRIRQSTNA